MRSGASPLRSSIARQCDSARRTKWRCSVASPITKKREKLFSRKDGALVWVSPTEFIRRASADYQRPGDAEDVTHKVEIFGGMPTPKGNCSRQFGIYGPHSYNDDGSVAREYEWADDRPALHEIDPADLPVLSRKVAGEILSAFERLATEAEWQLIVTIAAAHRLRRQQPIYDIDENTRFETNQGGCEIDYEELCDEQADLRRQPALHLVVHRRAFGARTPIAAGCSGRRGMIAWRSIVYGDEVTHYPKEKSPDAVAAAFSATLRELIADLDAQQAAVEARGRSRDRAGAARSGSKAGR